MDEEEGFLELGTQLRAWLDSSGTSVRAAARTSGLHRSVIQRHRDGRFVAMTARNLTRFAHLIGAKTWEDLLGPIPPDETAFLLGDSNRQHLLDAVESARDDRNLVPFSPEPEEDAEA